MWIAAHSTSGNRSAQTATSVFPTHRPLPSGPQEDPMADDRDYTRDENPHQGASHSFGKNIGHSDAERSIETGRETRNASGRSPATAPARGTGSGGSLHIDATHGRRHGPSVRKLRNRSRVRPRGSRRSLARHVRQRNRRHGCPQVETFRRDDKLVVRADLPGLKKDDVKVEIDNGMLTISGQRSSEREEKRDEFYRSERSYGSFYRAIPLPEGIESDNCEATFKDGVLEVTLPGTEARRGPHAADPDSVKTEAADVTLEDLMPERETIERARHDAARGRSPSTQAGEFVHEEIRHIRAGKHGARSTKQAIAIGLSKARRSGVKLRASKTSSARTRTQAKRDLAKGKRRNRKTSRTRSRAVEGALRREGRRAATRRSLSRQAHASARRRSAASRSAAARQAARTKGVRGRSTAARKAARTRSRRAGRAG